MLKPAIFWGASGHAKVLREFIASTGHELVALFDNEVGVTPPFVDVPVHCGRAGFEEWRKKTGATPAAFLVAIGGDKGRDRLEIQNFLASRGLIPLTVTHPTAFVATSAAIGCGSQILALSAVAAEARLGEGCIINTRASVDHECVLGCGVHIAPGATLAGCVKVGDFSMVGAGAVVLPRITIGKNAVIGAGAVVTKDVPDNKVVFGNPARIMRVNF